MYKEDKIEKEEKLRTELGLRLKYFREIAGINSQQAIADILNISQTQYSKLERNNKREPTLLNFYMLYKELNINLNWLIAGEGNVYKDTPEKELTDDFINNLLFHIKTVDKFKELIEFIMDNPTRIKYLFGFMESLAHK